MKIILNCPLCFYSSVNFSANTDMVHHEITEWEKIHWGTNKITMLPVYGYCTCSAAKSGVFVFVKTKQLQRRQCYVLKSYTQYYVQYLIYYCLLSFTYFIVVVLHRFYYYIVIIFYFSYAFVSHMLCWCSGGVSMPGNS